MAKSAALTKAKIKNTSSSVSVQVRIKSDLLKRAKPVLEEFDLNLSEAIRLFLNDVARNRRIPITLILNPKSNQQQAKEALGRLAETGQTLGNNWLKEQDFEPEKVSEEEFYNLLAKNGKSTA